MTKILFEPEALHLRIEGHAGSAEKGEDIVCAGVSALGYTLLLEAGREEFGAEIESDVRDGLLDVKCSPSGEWEAEMCLYMLEIIAGGLELIAHQYPAFAEYERR